MASIPASAIVSVTPSVIGAGGTALDLNGLILTTSAQAPVGIVVEFASAADVGTYFGPSSDEAAAAAIYFNGFDNSNKKPGALLFAQYPIAPVAAYTRGADAGTLDTVKALSAGTLTITVDGVSKTSASINLAAASSFSNAASLILAGFTTPGFTVTYDSVSGGFVFTSSTTGAGSTSGYVSGTLAAGLKLTQATGAVLSQGSVAAVPATFMAAVAQTTQNWASFTTLFDPDGGSGNDEKLLFAAWTNSAGNRYLYVPWDDDAAPTTSNDATTSLGNILKVANSTGTAPVYAPDSDYAVFVLGYVASIDFEQTNGRATLAFRSQTGLAPVVTNETVADNLMANGYNFYGSYATANDQFVFTYPGLVSGPYAWVDSYVNQIWLNNALQLAILSGLVQAKSVPYNAAGYALIRAWCMDPINAALNFGAIRQGVTLSAAQIAEVNSAAGVNIASVLSTQGFYLQVKDATPQVRAARGSPPCSLWYMDGGSVQSINLASILVQ